MLVSFPRPSPAREIMFGLFTGFTHASIIIMLINKLRGRVYIALRWFILAATAVGGVGNVTTTIIVRVTRVRRSVSLPLSLHMCARYDNTNGK